MHQTSGKAVRHSEHCSKAKIDIVLNVQKNVYVHVCVVSLLVSSTFGKMSTMSLKSKNYSCGTCIW